MSESIQLPMFDAIEIPLTNGYVTYVDSIDADLLPMGWFANNVSRKPQSSMYAVRSIYRPKRTTIYLHRVIAARINGQDLIKNMLVDHIDGNSLNNRRSNLRICDSKGNVRNAKKQSGTSTPYKGVCKTKNGSYIAYIRADGHRINLGSYSDPVAAARAYDAAALEYHGDFARTNVMLGLLPPLEVGSGKPSGIVYIKAFTTTEAK